MQKYEIHRNQVEASTSDNELDNIIKKLSNKDNDIRFYQKFARKIESKKK